MHRRLDIGRAAQLLDFEPKVTRGQGLERTINNFQERLTRSAGLPQARADLHRCALPGLAAKEREQFDALTAAP